MTAPKTHQDELKRLEELETRADLGGGPKAVERHRGQPANLPTPGASSHATKTPCEES